MLELRGLTKRFGGLVAVDDVSLRVTAGQVHCIIGPNGAGKSTLLGLLTGVASPTGGEIWLGDTRIDGLPPHRIARLGVARKFQVPSYFPDLTVRQNLAIAAAGHTGMPALLRASSAEMPLVERTLEQTELVDAADVPAGQLSHGAVQWLEIGMVVINRPRILLLDEPTAGMTPAETQETARLLMRLASDDATTTVVVEHDMDFVREVGERITVLHKGAVLREGGIDEIERDPEVRRVYLGLDDGVSNGA